MSDRIRGRRPSAAAVITRREFVVDAASVLAALSATAAVPRPSGPAAGEYGRLTARPIRTPTDLLAPGDHALSTTASRPATVFVPSSVRGDHPAPLMLALHGATGDSDEALRANRDAAEAAGVIVLAPSSEGVTWDAIRGLYETDFDRIDQTLAHVFQHCSVDSHRLAISGFSDGASYAISLGLVNGDLFTHVIAHSAGFIIPGHPHGHPKIFMAHGRQDRILPIDTCGRRIAAELQRDGYDVQLAEFDGGHMVRPEMVDRAMHWFAA
jgi:phospholipase/carboxylesterase